MTAIMRISALLLAWLVVTLLTGCSSERDRQWYKPNVNYTVDDFKRDRDACTKGPDMDEDCMKERGWVPLTSDRGPAPMLQPTKNQKNQRGPGY